MDRRHSQTALPPMAVKSLDEREGVRTHIDRGEPAAAAAGYGGQARSIAMSMVVKDALLRHYGSFKAAAISMGEMDQGQLTRDLDSGKFKFERLELCDVAAKAYVCRALAEAFGNTDPKARVQRLLRELHRALDELAEAVA
jgi:hypothetical protein